MSSKNSNLNAKIFHIARSRKLLFLLFIIFLTLTVFEPSKGRQIRRNTIFKQVPPDKPLTDTSSSKEYLQNQTDQMMGPDTDFHSQDHIKQTGIECQIRTDGSLACCINQ